MKLSRFGKLQMNNPARAAAQRRYTATQMVRLGGEVPGGHVLEVGCGRGVGLEIILDGFGAARVDSFDLDLEQVRLAKRRVSRFQSCVATVFVADVASIPARDSTYDAVFDFGAIHQVVNWREATAEVARVLRPGGRFFFEAISSPVYRLLMPLSMEDGTDVRKIGFDKNSFLAELQVHGIEVGMNYVQPRSPLTPSFVGDLIGVGQLRAA